MVTKFVLLVGLIVQTATLLDAAKRHQVLQSQCETPPLDSSITKEWVEKSSPSGGWYFPMFSKSNTKSSPQNDIVHNIVVPQKYSGKEDFCPRATWDGSTGELSFYGQMRAIFKCSANGTYTYQQCTVTDPHNEEEPEKVNVFMTLSDNQSYIFVIRCWEDGHQDWSLGTTTGDKVSETIKERVLEHADSLGFDRDAYHEISYEKCSG